MSNRWQISMLFPLLFAVGCASGPDDDGGAVSESIGEPSRAEYKLWWTAFARAEPEWPDYRELWLSSGPRARDRLMAGLLATLVKGNQADDGTGQRAPLWKRCGSEFRYFGSDGIRPLREAVRVHVDQKVVEWVSVDRLLRTLAAVADADEVTQLLEGADDNGRLRLATAKALAEMENASAVDPLCELAREDDDWQVRAAAVVGLGRWAPLTGLGEPSAFSRDALVAALGDEDRYVRQCACSALARVRMPGVQFALVDRLERAGRQGDRDFAAALHDALKTNTHELSVPQDANAWRLVLSGEDG